MRLRLFPSLAALFIGLPLIDNLQLGRLAERCAATGRYEFLFTLGALRVVGGTGCPVNPIAVL